MIRSRKISFSLLIFRLLVVVKSISKCVVNEDHVDSVSVSGESGRPFQVLCKQKKLI